MEYLSVAESPNKKQWLYTEIQQGCIQLEPNEGKLKWGKIYLNILLHYSLGYTILLVILLHYPIGYTTTLSYWLFYYMILLVILLHDYVGYTTT